MKNAVTALLLAVSAHSATAQRGPCRTSASNNIGSCNNGTVAATSCNTYRQLTSEGQHCTLNQRLTGTFATVQDCAEAVAADGTCLGAGVFSYGDGHCDCTTSATCTVGNGGGHALFVVTAPTDAFCSCPAVIGADSDEIYGGQRCEQRFNNKDDKPERKHDPVFVRELNALNDAVNSGRVQITASAISQEKNGINIFNDIYLVDSAVVLGRGFDGEFKLAMSLTSDVPLAEWQEIIYESIVENVVADGFDVTTRHFRIVDADTRSASVNCICPPLTIPGQPCVVDTAALCTQHIVHLVITEEAEFEVYQISLIIVACVIAVCLIAIGLSFVKSQETIDAEKNPELGVRARGLHARSHAFVMDGLSRTAPRGSAPVNAAAMLAPACCWRCCCWLMHHLLATTAWHCMTCCPHTIVAASSSSRREGARRGGRDAGDEKGVNSLPGALSPLGQVCAAELS
jgi:hypothetical protein